VICVQIIAETFKNGSRAESRIRFQLAGLRFSSWTKDVQQQRVEFVVRANRGESLSALCREFEITRPTGYLWLRRLAGDPAQVRGRRAQLEQRIETAFALFS
jgi:transposase-like protein